MIGRLKGIIVDRLHPGKLVLEVQGVGYDVETSLNTFFALESQAQEVVLHIHTVVREDAFLLYGFLELSERALFRSLIKINGVGPKLAISILSSISPEEFIQCIQSEDPVRLVKLPGIGKKTAERLVIEMRDSIQSLSLPGQAEIALPQMSASVKDEAISALLSLGYKAHDAKKVIGQLDDGQRNCEQLIRLSLQMLSKH